MNLPQPGHDDDDDDDDDDGDDKLSLIMMILISTAFMHFPEKVLISLKFSSHLDRPLAADFDARSH